MLSSSAVRRRRGVRTRTSRRSVALRSTGMVGGRCDGAAIIATDPRARTRAGALPWTIRADSSTPSTPPPPPAVDAAAAARSARADRASRRRACARRSGDPRCRAWRSSWPTSTWPRRKRAQIAGEVGRVAALGALAIALVIFAVFLARHRHVAVARGVAARLDGLGRPPRRPAVPRRSRWRPSSVAVGIAPATARRCLARARIVVGVVVGVVLALDLLNSSTRRSATPRRLPSTRASARSSSGCCSAASSGYRGRHRRGRPDERLGRRSLRRRSPG